MKIKPEKAGLVLGGVLGGLHLVWSLLIALGWAQWLITFSSWAHMVQPFIMVGPFDLTAAVTVIVVSGVIGFALGYVLATLWNKVNKY